MATRSFIGMLDKDGKGVRSVYCHWDGYPTGVGKVLRDHWTDPQKVKELMDEGDLSTLGETLGTQHSFGATPPGWCCFYGRDRGERQVEARWSSDLSEFLGVAQSCGAEYAYLLDSEMWRCWSTSEDHVEINMYSRDFEGWTSELKPV